MTFPPVYDDLEEQLARKFGLDAFEACRVEAEECINDVKNGAPTRPIYFGTIDQSIIYIGDQPAP